MFDGNMLLMMAKGGELPPSGWRRFLAVLGLLVFWPAMEILVGATWVWWSFGEASRGRDFLLILGLGVLFLSIGFLRFAYRVGTRTSQTESLLSIEGGSDGE